MIWLSSDFHFCHNRDFVYGARGFENVYAMNQAIVKNWNERVDVQDECYVLGDIMLNDNQTGIELLKQLHGDIHIICGNHDTETRLSEYAKCYNIVDICHADALNYNGYHFFLSHYPTLTTNGDKDSLKKMTLNLYGHTHQKTNFFQDLPFMYHVGVDSHDCAPVCIDDIIAEMWDKWNYRNDRRQIII